MNTTKWLYVSDYNSDYKRGKPDPLYIDCLYWYVRGYRVFVQGYSAMQCEEFIPPSHYHYVRGKPCTTSSN